MPTLGKKKIKEYLSKFIIGEDFKGSDKRFYTDS